MISVDAGFVEQWKKLRAGSFMSGLLSNLQDMALILEIKSNWEIGSIGMKECQCMGIGIILALTFKLQLQINHSGMDKDKMPKHPHPP